MPSYIEKRRRRWYAVLDIPKNVQDHIGKRRFVQSLETENQSVALRRVMPLVANWKGEIEAARTGTRDPIERDAAFWLKALKGAATDEENCVR